MCRSNGFRLIASVFILWIMNVSAYALDYIQLSSFTSQAAGKAPTLVSFDKVNGVSSHRHHVTVKEGGVYFVMVSAQIGSVKNELQANGYVDLWMEQNGKAIPGSNTRTSVNQNAISVLVSQLLVNMKAGDTVDVVFASDNPNLGLPAFPATSKEPAISSINFSLYKF